MSEELTPLKAVENEIAYHRNRLSNALKRKSELEAPVGKLCSFYLLADVVDSDENGLLIQLKGNRFAEFWVEHSALNEVIT